MFKRIISIYILIFSTFLLFGQEVISYSGSGNFVLTEKTDLRRYDNGKYTGLVSREISSYIIPVSVEGGYLYEGSFFVWQDTVRGAMSVGFGMNESIPAVFKIGHDGAFTMLEDHGYPSFRSFPTYSTKKIKKGDIWQAKAERAVDPLNKGVITKMPIYVQYKYLSDVEFHGEPCYLISAEWATRYGMGAGTYYIDWGGDKDLLRATGSHKANIWVSKYSGNAIVIKDTVDETFEYADGNKIQFKGSISQFTEYPPAVDYSDLIPALKRIAAIDSEQIADEKKHTSEFEKQLAMEDGKTAAKKGQGIDDSIGEGADTGIGSAEDLKGDGGKTVALAEGAGKGTDSAGKSVTGTDSTGTDVTGTESNVADDLNVAEKKAVAMADTVNDSKDETVGGAQSGIARRESVIQQLAAETEKGTAKSVEKKEALVTVDNTPAGIRLTIPNLQFKPDSAELLGGEKDRLDKIAQVLQTVPQCRLLIEGHTAAVGKEAGELQLSKERALAIANALVMRGVSKDRLIVKGSGGKKPVADNTTAEGKAKNRRVEITILE